MAAVTRSPKSEVNMVADIGLDLGKFTANESMSIPRPPMTTTVAKMPTAIDSTTSIVRSLWAVRSRRILAQRGSSSILSALRARPVDGLLDDLAVVHVERTPHPGRDVVVVGHHHDRLVAVHQRFEESEDRIGGGRVQVARRLVGREDRRVVGQRPRDGDALL